MSTFKMSVSVSAIFFWVHALQRAIRELTPRTVHTNSWSRSSQRWNAGAVIKNSAVGARLPRQEFLSLYGKVHVHVQKKGKKVDVVRTWTGYKAPTTNAVTEAVATANAITSSGDIDLRMAEVKGWGVADPFAAQAAAWNSRVVWAPKPAPKQAAPGYKGVYTTPAPSWTAPVYAVSTPEAAARVVPTHRIVRFSPATLTTAATLAVGGVVAAGISGVIKAHYTERRRINRESFTLDAVIALTATRKGTARVRAGGVGFTAYANVALVAAVADVLVAIATTVGTTSTRARRRVRKSMNVNQTIARVARKKRQRRASTLRRRNLKPQVKSGYEKQLAKAQRRAAAKRLAAAIAAEKAAKKKVITRYALCAERRAGNNAIYLANGQVAPILREQKEYHNQVAAQDEAARPLAEQNRRRAAMGLPLIGNDKKVDKTVYLATKAEEKRAQAAYEAGTTIMAEILNGSDSEPVAVPAEFMALAEVRCATSAEGIPEASMSLRRSRTERPRTKATERPTKKVSTARSSSSEDKKPSGNWLTPQIRCKKFWEIATKKHEDLNQILEYVCNLYRKQTKSEAKDSTIHGYLRKAFVEGLIKTEELLDEQDIAAVAEARALGVSFSDMGEHVGFHDFAAAVAWSLLSAAAKEDEKAPAKTSAKRETENTTKTKQVGASAKRETEKTKEASKPNRFDLVKAIWDKLLDQEEPVLEDMLDSLCDEYVKQTNSTAKKESIQNYLVELYANGTYKWEDVLSQGVIDAVLAEAKPGVSYGDIASNLGYTYFEVCLSNKLDPSKPKEKPMTATKPGLEIVVDAPMIIDDLEAMGCVPLFTLKNEGAAPLKESDPLYVVVGRYSPNGKANANAHFGLMPLDDRWTESYTQYFYDEDNSRHDIPTCDMLAYDFTDEDKQGWNSSPIGIVPARLYTNMMFRKDISRVFRDAAFTNVKGLSFTNKISHNVSYRSMVNGEHDLLDRKKGRSDVGDMATLIRGLTRQAAYTGNAKAIERVAKQGNIVEFHNAIADVEAEATGIITPEGNELEQYYLVVVARAHTIYDERRMGDRGKKDRGQYRVYADHFEVFHVGGDVVENLFDLEDASSKQNRFTFVNREVKQEAKGKQESKTRRRVERSSANSKAAEADKKAKDKVADAKQKQKVAKKVEKQATKATAAAAALQRPEFAEELAALYKAAVTPSSGDRSDSYYSVDDVVDIFMGVDPDEYVAALQQMMPAADEDIILSRVTGKDKKVGLGQRIAYAVAYYLYGHLSEAGNHPCSIASLPLNDYDWELQDVKDCVDIIHQLFNAANQSTRKGKRLKARKIQDLIYFAEVDGVETLFIDGEEAFSFKEDTVYDWRGRAFSHILHIDAEKNPKTKKTVLNDVQLCTSISGFMRVFWYVYLPLLANWSGNRGLYANTLDNMKTAVQRLPEMFKMTTDRVSDQNGAVQHALKHTYAPMIHQDYSPFNKTKSGFLNWMYLGGSGAKKLVEHYNPTADDSDDYVSDFEFEGSDNSVEVNGVLDKAQRMAHKRYGIDFHYAKGQFVAGVLGHVNLDLVKEHAPTVFEAIREFLDLDSLEEELKDNAKDKAKDLFAYHVIANTIKAQKGLKRVTLSMAQSAPVENAKISAWQLYGQDTLAEGWLNAAGYAPTHVTMPGLSPFFGKQSDKPVALPVRRLSYTRNSFDIVDGTPFDFEYSTLQGVEDAEWDTVESKTGWMITTPTTPVYVRGTRDEIICEVHGGDAIWHQQPVEGTLLQIRWRVATGINNVDEVLKVEYFIHTSEFDMKSRQCNKDQFFTTTPQVLFNDLNAELVEIRDSIDVKGLHLQDAMKMDTTYSWLFIIANTVYYNAESTHPAYTAMREEIVAINNQIVGHDNLVNGQPVLVIEPASVATGAYERLQKTFTETFAQTRWLHWPSAGDYGRIMWDLYSNKVNAKEWHNLDLDTALEYAPEIASLEGVEGGDLVIMSREAEPAETDVILVFVRDEHGTVLEVAQRGVMFLAVPGFQIYNVELFESSTVKEAITESIQLMATIKSLSVVCGYDADVLEEQRSMFRDGIGSLYRAKALYAMQNANVFSKDFKVIDIIVDDRGVGFGDSEDAEEALTKIDAELAAAGVDVKNIDRHRKGLFKIFAQACKDVVFRVEANEGEVYTLWLPAMYQFTKLSSKSDECRDYVSTFFYEVLLPCIEGREAGSQLIINQAIGMMNSLASSRNTRKFFNGRPTVGAKRISLPNIPSGETWILVNHSESNLYKQCVRSGIPVDDLSKVAEGIVTYGSRPPMPLGNVARIRLVEEIWEEVDGVEVYRGQKLIPFKGEVLPDEYLPYELSPVQIGVSAMDVYLDAGDFDGDGHFIVLLKTLGLKYLTTYEKVVEARSAAIGMPMFDAKCESYAADHYGIKTFDKACVTLVDLASVLRHSALKPAEEYINYNILANEIQNTAVGVMYGAYMTSEIIISLTRSLDSAGMSELIPPEYMPLLDCEDIDALVTMVAEIYEIMLGGFSKGAGMLWTKYLKSLMQQSMFDVTSIVETNEAVLKECTELSEVQRAIKKLVFGKGDYFKGFNKLYDKYAEMYGKLGLNEAGVIEALRNNASLVEVTTKEERERIELFNKSLDSKLYKVSVSKDFNNLLVKMGANNKHSDLILSLLKGMYSYYGAKTDPEALRSDLFTSMAIVLFEAGRGKALLFEHGLNKSAAKHHVVAFETVDAWLQDLKETEAGRKLIDNNLNLYSLSLFADVLGEEILLPCVEAEEGAEPTPIKPSEITWVERDLAYFLDALGETKATVSLINNANAVEEDEDEDEDNEEGNGGEPAPTEPDSDDDGGLENEDYDNDDLALDEMSYRELQALVKELKAKGHDMPKANAKREVLLQALTEFYSTEEEESTDSQDVAAEEEEVSTDSSDIATDKEEEQEEVSTTYSEDGLFVQQYFCQDEGIYDELRTAIEETFDKGEKTRFTAKSYSYTCAGQQFWVWNKGKGRYLNTQPSGSAVVEMPSILKETAEKIVAKLGVFEGYEAQTCLINRYEGAQKLNLHVDKDEDVDAPIVSFSFGSTGIFQIDGDQYEVGDGDLIIFYGSKRFARHGYEGNEGGKGVRYNVTVRMVNKTVVTEPEPEQEPIVEEAEVEETLEMDYPEVVISGSRSIKELPNEALDVIDAFIERGASFNVGDAYGVDKLVQSYLHEQGVTEVRVWFSKFKGCRNNVGNFSTKPVAGNFTARDEKMHRGCDESLVIWDGVSPGSKKNIERVDNTIVINVAELAAQEKENETVVANDKVVVKTIEELLALDMSESTRRAVREAYNKLVASLETEGSTSSADAETEENVPNQEDFIPELPDFEDDDVPLASVESLKSEDAPSAEVETEDKEEEKGEEDTTPLSMDEEEEEDFAPELPDFEDDDVPLASVTSLSTDTPPSAPPASASVTTKTETSKNDQKSKTIIPSVKEIRKQKQKAKDKRMAPYKVKTKPTADDAAVEASLERINDLLPSKAALYSSDYLGSLTSSQLSVPETILNGHNVMLTGVGGGGKSYTVEVLRKLLDALRRPYIVVGSTGTSVMNVEGNGTFNSVFGLKTGFGKDDKKAASEYRDLKVAVSKSRFLQSERAKLSSHRTLIIVDEISMVDNRLLHAVQDALEHNKVDVQWLLVGDPMQFLPISGGLYFESFKCVNTANSNSYKGNDFLKRLDFKTINLTENIRAGKDKLWVDTLNEMRLDCFSIERQDSRNILWERFQASKQGLPEDAVHLYYNNAGVKRHNAKRTEEMIANGAESRTYVADITRESSKWWKKNPRSENDNTTIYDPIDVKMTFCVGMPVMIRLNITDERGVLVAANGSRGFVTELAEKYIKVQLSVNDKIVKIERQPMHSPLDERGNPKGYFTTIPAHPCFAMTMHKAQGLTLDCPTVIHAYYLRQGKVRPIGHTSPNALYVAFSRVTKAEYVYIATSTPFDENISESRMWSLLTQSYHTSDKALDWMEGVEAETICS